MLPDKNGVYIAQPTNIAIEEKTSGTVQANVQFSLVEYRGQDGKSAEPADAQIIAYMNLITKAGKLNEINARAFRESFGWDGVSFANLANMDLADVQCQVVIADEPDQNGNTVKRVKYINPRDYSGAGVGTSDPATVQSLDAKYGSLLRATAGTSTARAAKPASKPPVVAGKPTAQGQNGVDLAKQTAYAKYVSKVDDYGRSTPNDAYSNAERTDVFKKLVGDYGSEIGKDAKSWTPTDWTTFMGKMERDFDVATREFIPF